MRTDCKSSTYFSSVANSSSKIFSRLPKNILCHHFITVVYIYCTSFYLYVYGLLWKEIDIIDWEYCNIVLVLAPCWEIILLWELEIEMRLLWDVAAKCDRGIDLLYPTQSQIFKILNELHKMVTLNKRKENIQSQHIKGTGLVTWLRGRHYHSSLPPAIIYFSGPSTIISVSSDDDDDDNDDQKEPGDHLQLSLAAPPFFLTPFVSPGVGRWRW